MRGIELMHPSAHRVRIKSCGGLASAHIKNLIHAHRTIRRIGNLIRSEVLEQTLHRMLTGIIRGNLTEINRLVAELQMHRGTLERNLSA